MTCFPFRENHLFNILGIFDGEKAPLDSFLREYFRSHKAIGSKDRRFISETIYGMFRWRALLDHLCVKPPSWIKRYEVYSQIHPPDYLDKKEIPAHIRVSFPKSFFELLVCSLGEERALEFCALCNDPAPITLRVNRLKTTRDALLEKWRALHPVSPCLDSPSGIIFHRRINFFELSEFREGLFEIQDEASQLIGALVRAEPGDLVLDFCAGSGGKTLAFAPSMNHRGQIYLHDIRLRALQEARKRLKRAGVQNAQLLPPESITKETLKGRMDWVLVDVPCSGSGTLRRNPDMKWKFEQATLERLIQQQREIFQEALDFVGPKGSIVYATCSVLPQENERQIAFFQEKFNLRCLQPPFQSSLKKNGMDGFFGAVLKK
jgi:16S rRNA (cytosine967-C5)-methyltransferase